jgi:uncharacterized protein
MRRNDKEILDKNIIAQIIHQAQVCRLGLCRDGQPYIVPLSFGYDGQSIYFHTALEGRKIDFMTANPRVCFELEHDVKVLPHDTVACQWTFSFYSIIGFGTVTEITASPLKAAALNQIMQKYSGRAWEFNDQQLAKTRLWRLAIDQISCKASKDKLPV